MSERVRSTQLSTRLQHIHIISAGGDGVPFLIDVQTIGGALEQYRYGNFVARFWTTGTVQYF